MFDEIKVAGGWLLPKDMRTSRGIWMAFSSFRWSNTCFSLASEHGKSFFQTREFNLLPVYFPFTENHGTWSSIIVGLLGLISDRQRQTTSREEMPVMWSLFVALFVPLRFCPI